jgi:hypothetical protein
VEQERFTSLDRGLLCEADQGIVSSGTVAGNAFRQTLLAGRLQRLRRLGLAEETAPGRLKLAPTSSWCCAAWASAATSSRPCTASWPGKAWCRGAADLAFYDPTSRHERELVGRVTGRGLSDELDDRHYLIVDGVDGRAHYVYIATADADPPAVGGIFAIETKPTEPRPVDHTAVEIAAAHGYRHSVHLEHDRTAHAAFAEAHVRRLEALRRAGAGIEREADGTWIIAPDHLDRAAAYERMQARASPVIVRTLSVLPLDRQVGAEGATWLDRELLADAPRRRLRAGGAGRAGAAPAMAGRAGAGPTGAGPDCLSLQHDGTAAAASRWTPMRGSRASIVSGSSSRAGGSTVIEKSREFTLVPWRPVLERNLARRCPG